MNWQSFGVIADIVGAIAVVVSLLYVAGQIRQSRRESRAAAGETAIRSFREVLIPLYSDATLSKMYSRIWTDPEVFKGPERDQAFQIMFQSVKALESVHFHYLNGMLESGTWSGWRNLFLHYINTPGFHHYWGLRQDAYSPAFQEWIRENATHTSGVSIGRLGAAKKDNAA